MRFEHGFEFDAPVAGLNMTGRELFGNKDAFDLSVSLIEISNVWDDLIDGEKVGAADVNWAFYSALIDLPSNAFYREHIVQLHPLMMSAVFDFLIANHWENARDEHGLELGHVMRYSISRVIAHIVLITRGAEFSMKVLPDLYKVLCGERFEEYRKEVVSREVTDG